MTSPASNSVTPCRFSWTRHWKTGSPAWWAWLAIGSLLAAALAGNDGARAFALALATLQAFVYVMRHRSLSHFPTQVRVAYVLWMVVSFVPGMTPLFWIQAVGTTALVAFGYCPLARILLFLPQNRTVPLTALRAWRIIFHPPTSGSVLEDLKM